MPSLQTYLEYNDPNINIWRSGTQNNPFKPRSDSLVVINNTVTLLEVPSETEKVMVAGFTEISQEAFKKKTYIADNEFLVDYATGIVMFNPAHEAKTFVFNYYGRGISLMAASRVYAMVQRNPDIVITLQDYVDGLQIISKNLNLQLIEINNAISNAVQATTEANIATDNASIAIENAEIATQNANDAAASVVVVRKDPVDTYQDIDLAYPDPENGWQVTLNTNGDVYRYDGIVSNQWILIGNMLGGTMPYVSEISDGILHKEDYQNFVMRTMFFSIPKILSQGVQTIGLGKLPYDGELVKAQAYCVESGISNQTEIAIETISEVDFGNNGVWDNILSQNLVMPVGELKSTGGTIVDTEGLKGDLFRINISQFDNSIKGITVQLDINTKI